jgi:HTH-type transcriptional regulator/antitoxin HipB
VPKDFPIRFASQMRQHLRALRKKHGLTQAQLGALVGVSQARIAEIEANPGLVNLDQMLQLLATLGATLTLEENASTPTATSEKAPTKGKEKSSKAPQATRQPSATAMLEKPSPTPKKNAKSTLQSALAARTKKGSW